jgi:hypothetical protein
MPNKKEIEDALSAFVVAKMGNIMLNFHLPFVSDPYQFVGEFLDDINDILESIEYDVQIGNMNSDHWVVMYGSRTLGKEIILGMLKPHTDAYNLANELYQYEVVSRAIEGRIKGNA